MISFFFNTISYEMYILFHIIFILLSLMVIFSRSKISKFFNIIDFPNNSLKIHDIPTPRIGGLIMFLYLIPSIIIDYFITPIGTKEIFIILIILIIFFSIGFIDDQKTLTASKKCFILLSFLFLFIPISDQLIINKLIFRDLNFSINLNQGSIFFTIFAIFALYNAFNFSDGINGVASSLGIFWIIFVIFKSGNYSSFYYQSILISLLIILYFNLKKKLFLGNSGTSLFSVVISFIFINEYNNKNIFCDEILFLLFLPGIDMIRLTISRISSGKSPFNGDQNHLHHIMFNKIKGKYVLFYYIIFATLPSLSYFFLSRSFYINLFFSIFIYFLIFVILNKLKKFN